MHVRVRWLLSTKGKHLKGEKGVRQPPKNHVNRKVKMTSAGDKNVQKFTKEGSPTGKQNCSHVQRKGNLSILKKKTGTLFIQD